MTQQITPFIKPTLRALLDALKQRGRATVPELAGDLDLNVETVRDHLRSLEARDLARRDGTRAQGPGRPEVVYVLTPAAEALFPRREGEILRGLARYLVAHGQGPQLRGFLAEYAAERRDRGLARVAGLEGEERVRAVARLLDEMGFMPVLDERGATLRLCHCPMGDLVEATDLPCREEIGMLRDLLGAPMTRIEHRPNGDLACAYRMGPAA